QGRELPSLRGGGGLHGDGKTDLATANFLSNNVSVLLQQARAISVSLVKEQVGLTRQLFVQVSYDDTGDVMSEFRSPYQGPAYSQITAIAFDSDGDGIPDAVKLRARDVATNQLVHRIYHF